MRFKAGAVGSYFGRITGREKQARDFVQRCSFIVSRLSFSVRFPVLNSPHGGVIEAAATEEEIFLRKVFATSAVSNPRADGL